MQLVIIFFSFVFNLLFSAPKERGQDGTVNESYIRISEVIDPQSAANFPEELLLIIRRQAVELLLGDTNDWRGRDALQFIVDVTTGRDDVKYIKIGESLEIIYNWTITHYGTGTGYIMDSVYQIKIIKKIA